MPGREVRPYRLRLRPVRTREQMPAGPEVVVEAQHPGEPLRFRRYRESYSLAIRSSKSSYHRAS